MPESSLRCGHCKFFDHSKGKAGQCTWLIPECSGPRGKFAQECALYTDLKGNMRLDDESFQVVLKDQTQLDLF